MVEKIDTKRKSPVRKIVNQIQVIFYITFVLLGQLESLAQTPDSLLYKQLPGYPFVFISDSIVTSPPIEDRQSVV